MAVSDNAYNADAYMEDFDMQLHYENMPIQT